MCSHRIATGGIMQSTPRLVLITVTAIATLTVIGAAQGPRLPAPFATPSATNRTTVVAKPDARELRVPMGFRVNVFADNLRAPRTMAYSPNGDLFVAQSNAGSILILRDTNTDGAADQRVVYAEGLQRPFGLAFQSGYLYVGEEGRIVRYRYQPGETRPSGMAQQVVQLPTRGHWTRNIIFSADGRKMYVAVGSQSNKNDGEDPVRAAINEYNPDGTGHRIFASGLRNPVGMAWQPGTNVLWTVVNERDTLGDDLVPDYATSVKDGGFYGWPYSYIGSNYDPEHAGKMVDLVRRAIVPDVLLPAHSAALGITFYTATQFPQRYRNGAFVALHGSWNRATPSGYEVVFVPFQNGRPGPVEDFVSGWHLTDNPNTTWGRPVGVLVARDGSLLISDDGGGKIWRVNYAGAP
jgi:glucose/arabinose dehydrogenase